VSYATRAGDDAFASVDVSDMEPYAPHTALVLPFLGSGFRSVGGRSFYLSYSNSLYPMCARVLKVHATCTRIKAGDVVYLADAYCYDDIRRADGRACALLDERAAVAVIKDFDTQDVTV
jgi:hypothetical protein